MVENNHDQTNLNELKFKLRQVEENPNLIDMNSINCVVFGYDFKDGTVTKDEKIISTMPDVRSLIIEQIKENLNHILQEGDLVEWGSVPDNSGSSDLEVVDIDTIMDSELTPIIENPDLTERLNNVTILNKWKHLGLLIIANLSDNLGKLIGISSLRRIKIASRKKKYLSLDGGSDDVFLKFVRDVYLFSLSDLFDAIYLDRKIILINEDRFFNLFVLNKKFEKIYEQNINLISGFITDPQLLFDKINGKLKFQKTMLSIIRQNLRNNIAPSRFKEMVEDEDKYKVFFENRIFFDENSKIDISRSDVRETLNLLSEKYDKAPVSGIRRKVSPHSYA